VLFREGDALVVDERGVFHGGDARADRVLDAFGRVGVGGHAKPEIACLFHRRAKLGIFLFRHTQTVRAITDIQPDRCNNIP